jgi:DNA uptake protein ComE-like DNA-binding protein
MARRKDEVMGHTHRGVSWEYKQSWYVLGLLSFWTYWFPLVYTGLRTFRFRWVFWGLVYGTPSFLTFIIDPADFGAEEFFRKWMFASLMVAGVHTFVARGEFLVRLADDHEEKESLMEEARLKREGGAGVAEEEDGMPAAPAPRSRFLLDVNTVGERELAMLPGMGSERARQAVALRTQLGGYRSFDHFAEKMALTTEVRAKLAGLFQQPEPEAPPSPTSSIEYHDTLDGRRVLELNVAGVEGFATLPGLNADLARKAVQLRESDGPYKSAEDFRYRMGLKMDVMNKIMPLVSTHRLPPSATPGVKPSRRIVDL